MAKHSKSVSLIIVAVDFKFKAFDYERFEIEYLEKKNLSDRFAFGLQNVLDRTVIRIFDTINKSRFN